MQQYVIDKKENRLNIFKIKYIKDGIIYCQKNKEYSAEATQILFGQGKEYYLVGNLSPQDEAMLEHASRFFKNKFYKSLMRDKLSTSELIIALISVASGAVSFLSYTKVTKLIELIGGAVGGK